MFNREHPPVNQHGVRHAAIARYHSSPERDGMENNLVPLLHGRVGLAFRTAQPLVEPIKSKQLRATND
jgi:hypothetical protein